MSTYFTLVTLKKKFWSVVSLLTIEFYSYFTLKFSKSRFLLCRFFCFISFSTDEKVFDMYTSMKGGSSSGWFLCLYFWSRARYHKDVSGPPWRDQDDRKIVGAHVSLQESSPGWTWLVRPGVGLRQTTGAPQSTTDSRHRSSQGRPTSASPGPRSGFRLLYRTSLSDLTFVY